MQKSEQNGIEAEWALIPLFLVVLLSACWGPGPLIVSAQTDGLSPFASSDRSQGLPSVAPGERGMGLELASGYGFVDAGGGDHRLVVEGLVDGRPLDDLALRGSFRSRVDWVDGENLRTTFTGDLGLSYGHFVRPSLALGASVDARFGGGGFPDLDFGSTSLEARLGLLYRMGEGRAALAFDVGYLHDRSAESLASGADPSTPDRVALGVDENDALLFRFGASMGRGSLRGWLMLDASPRLGADAPFEGALELRGGAMGAVSASLGWSAFASIALTPTPSVEPGSELRAIPPRFSLGISLRYDPFASRRAEPQEPAEAAAEPPEEVAPPPAAAPVVVEAPPPTYSLRGSVVDDQGFPLSGAVIRHRLGGLEVETMTDVDGVFEIEDLPEGEVEIEVESEGFEVWSVAVATTLSESIPVQLVPLPPSTQLRGLVRGFHGGALDALVRITDQESELRTDDEGRFLIDLPPGEYRVEIRAEGWRTQRRRVRLQEGGVTVLNVELRRAR